MDITHTTAAAATTATVTPGALGGEAGLVVVALGPLATVLAIMSAVGGDHVSAAQLPMVLAVALVFWSPLPMSIPALVLQDARDAALPHLTGPLATLGRGVALIPWLVLSPRSGARFATAASVAGFVAAVAVAAPHLG